MEPNTGQFLHDGSSALTICVLSAKFDPVLGNSKISADSKKYLVIKSNSAVTPYSYILLYPPDYTSENAAIIRQFVSISAMTALLFGSLLSVIFVLLNYKPLKKIVAQIQKSCGGNQRIPTH